MAWCDKCGQQVKEDMAHGFAVYGPQYLRYHAECCPRIVDGTECDDEHSPAEEPEPPAEP